MIVGVDEAGTGSAIADIYACAMILDPALEDDPRINDSKKLTPKKRDAIYDAICASQSVFGVGIVTRFELDDIGMAAARRLVFERSLQDLKEQVPDRTFENVIFDGSFGVDVSNSLKTECIPQADGKYPCVSAASIVAKVSRDRSILQICEENRDLDALYGWSSNKGYLSAVHTKGIREHGLSGFHRKSFDYKCLRQDQ